MADERPIDSEKSESQRSKVISEFQKAIDAGLGSGPEVSFDPEAFKRNMLETRN